MTSFPSHFGTEICDFWNFPVLQDPSFFTGSVLILKFSRFCLRMLSWTLLGGILASFGGPLGLLGPFSGPKRDGREMVTLSFLSYLLPSARPPTPPKGAQIVSQRSPKRPQVLPKPSMGLKFESSKASCHTMSNWAGGVTRSDYNSYTIARSKKS